ncbi:MAG: hypothetical protein ACOZCL_11245 [Bacillota bacterium]
MDELIIKLASAANAHTAKAKSNKPYFACALSSMINCKNANEEPDPLYSELMLILQKSSVASIINKVSAKQRIKVMSVLPFYDI